MNMLSVFVNTKQKSQKGISCSVQKIIFDVTVALEVIKGVGNLAPIEWA